MNMMKNLAFVVSVSVFSFGLAACGSKQQTPVENAGGDGSAAPAPTDTRSAIEKRRDAACDSLGPRITTCAAVDAKAAKDAGQITQAQYDEITKKEILAKNTEEFVEACKAPQTPYSSRQIRVLEVCQAEETECGPLMACLDNLNKP
jgi:hypothetical protein